MRFFLKYAAIMEAAKSLKVREHGGWIFDADPVDPLPIPPDLGNEYAIVCHFKEKLEVAEAQVATLMDLLNQIEHEGAEAHRKGTADAHSFHLGMAIGHAMKGRYLTRVSERASAMLKVIEAAREGGCKCEYGSKATGPFTSQLTVWKECDICKALSRLDALRGKKP